MTEAEIQLMIALLELSKPIETPNNNEYEFYPKDIQQASKYFGKFLVDWSDAYSSLLEKEILSFQNGIYSLTEIGESIADKFRKERPPIWYWYKEYYIRTNESNAHAEYCEKLFGMNLCQDGFSDMKQINFLIKTTNIKSNDRILDLGCGSGMISEYISDKTGAEVYGIDYIPEAIEQAKCRTESKESRLKYKVGNLDYIDFPEDYFDLIISIDTLYMPNNLDATIKQMKKILKPAGAMAIYYSTILWGENYSRELLKAENTDLAKSLVSNGLKYEVFNFSKEDYELLQRKRQVCVKLKEEYIKEGNESLYNNIFIQSNNSTDQYDQDKCNTSRYLYYIIK